MRGAGLGDLLASGCPWPASPSSRRRPGTARRRSPSARPWSGRTSRRRSPRASWPGRRSRRRGRCRYCGISSPASSRSLILACAMSRATTSGPVSDSRVFTGYLRQLGEDLGHRPVEVDRARRRRRGARRWCRAGTAPGRSRAARGRRPPAVILPSACRSAEHDTAIATGHEAPCRGSRTTRTSWQKYLPPNCAPMPNDWVSLKTSSSSSRSRKPCAASEPVGRQVVEVVRRGVLRGLQRELRRRAADDDRQVVRRAGGRAERADLLVEEGPASAAGSGPPSSPGRGTTCSPSRRPWP